MSDDLEVRFSMSRKRRGSYDVEYMRIVVGLIRDGIGAKSLARRLGVSKETTREWLLSYRIGGEAALMGEREGNRKYDYETKLAAGGAAPEAQGQAEGREIQTETGSHARTAPRGGERVSQGEGRVSGKSPRPAGVEADTREKSVIVSTLAGLGHPLRCLLKIAGLARSTYYYLLSHPEPVTRPDIEPMVAEVFHRTPNGCGHRPWVKLGTDVTEFRAAGGKAYLAPIYDMGSKEIVAWDVSRHPDLAQQQRLLAMLEEKLPEDADPIPHSDMGWQYRHRWWRDRLAGLNIRQSMSRKGNCIDNAATEQVFGHLKDEFHAGREFASYEQFKNELDAYIIHWNTKRRQIRLEGHTPEEFRNMSLTA